MNKRKFTISLIVGIVLLLMVAAAVVLLFASRRPEAYRPYALTQAQRREVAQGFITKCLALGSQLGNKDPFTHTVKQDDLNRYLASLDELAFLRLQGDDVAEKSSEVVDAMDKAGLAYPAVNMDDDILTIMFRTEKINKVISVDLLLSITDDSRLKVEMGQVRVGKMPVPAILVSNALDSMKQSLAELEAKRKKKKTDGGFEEDEDDDDDRSDIRAGDFDLLLPKILSAIDEEPFSTEVKFRNARKKVTRVEIDDGELKIYFFPVER